MMLTPLSSLYQGVVRLRHYLYDHQFLTTRSAPLTTVSIGNVKAGGSGKTQVALLLDRYLSQHLKVAILSRGYKGKAEGATQPLVVNPKEHSPDLSGDEPWMLASRSSSLVLVNKNRYKSSLVAEQLGAEVLLLDDGMQHRQLARDFEIVVIDGTSPLDAFLPKGRLREDLQRLKTADLIFYVGSPEESIQQTVMSYSKAPHVVARIMCEGVFLYEKQEKIPIDRVPLAIFCGIGNPSRFVSTVKQEGAEVIATYFAPDHQLPNAATLRKFASAAKREGASILLCTEKDMVKLSGLKLPLPIAWMRTHLQPISNEGALQHLVNEIIIVAKGGLK